jgi:hypothetical protein
VEPERLCHYFKTDNWYQYNKTGFLGYKLACVVPAISILSLYCLNLKVCSYTLDQMLKKPIVSLDAQKNNAIRVSGKLGLNDVT